MDGELISKHTLQMKCRKCLLLQEQVAGTRLNDRRHCGEITGRGDAVNIFPEAQMWVVKEDGESVKVNHIKRRAAGESETAREKHKSFSLEEMLLQVRQE